MLARATKTSSMMTSVLSMVAIILVLMPAPVRLLVNMYENEPEIEVLDKTNFDSVVFGSDKATFVEFYAHWCGACKRYKPTIIEIAKTTKTWHSKVLRVSVVNCGDQFNDEFCRKHNIGHYPTIKIFPAQAVDNEKNAEHGATVLQLDSAENIVHRMIDFVEKQQQQQQQQNKQITSNWPDLTPFTSKRFETLFIPNKDLKFAVLIVEKEDSYLGRKLILDFSAHSDRLIIRRTTQTSNPSAIIRLDVDVRKMPAIYIVNNTKSSAIPVNTVPAEKLTEALVKRYKQSISVDFESDDDDLAGDLAGDVDAHDEERSRMSRLLRSFIKVNSLLTPEETNQIKEHLEAVNEHRDKVKKEEGEVYLANIKDKIYMQDLESGLHMMLRSDISHAKLISGKKLEALREWINILAKYFPGRKPVRSYLRNLNSKIQSPQLIEITGNQWKMIADESTANSFLPNTIEWKHCLGSEEKYRGYPCSLWSIFHVLTVNQIEIENEKKNPFENFNVKELVQGIRAFVLNFFTCRECAENFERETQDYLRNLKDPHDAIIYMWKVHNSVNRRLANDQITESDPKFPKRLFPSQTQCPNCYLPGIRNIDELSDHESPWNTKECLLFLSSYYSRYQIVPIDQTQIVNNNPNEQDRHQVDEPHIPDAVVDKLDEGFDEKDGEEKNNQLPNVPDGRFHPAAAGRDKPNLGLEAIDNEMDRGSGANKSDSTLALMFILVCFASFGIIYIYFTYLRRAGGKSKKHII